MFYLYFGIFLIRQENLDEDFLLYFNGKDLGHVSPGFGAIVRKKTPHTKAFRLTTQLPRELWTGKGSIFQQN